MAPITRSLVKTRMGHVHAVIAGHGPVPAVLLHQTARSVDEYAEVIPLLSPHMRVIAIDTPGYGCSDPVPRRPSISDYAGAIGDALDALDAPQAVIVGHHTGAIIAIEMAASQHARVQKLVLSGPVYLNAQARADMLPYFQQWRVRADGGHWAAKWRDLARWSANSHLLHRVAIDQFRAGEASEQGHFAVVNYDMDSRLPLVRCTALCLFHRRDPFTDETRAAPLISAFQPGTTATIDAGVFAPNEAPDEFVRAILRYLNH